MYFEIGSYIYGIAHDQTTLDFTKPHPEIVSEVLPKSGVSDRALTSVIRGVALGEIVLLESSRGSGGYNVAQGVLGRLIEKHCKKPPPLPGMSPHKNVNWPSIELMDVISDNLRDEIERGGGVDRLYLRVSEGVDADDESWAHRLRSQMNQLSHAQKFHAVWEADGDAFDTDAVMTAVDEAEQDDSGLDKIIINLKNGDKINRLDRFKVRDEVTVKVDSAGVIFKSDIVDGLWAFLDRLRQANSNSWRLIDDDGYFTTHATFSVKAKK
ncbi:hypothetical protein [Pseudomonas sp. CGJS7]|uniref:hypothetical protein n=1 Tax=Pseudomonas sp. CGJS7 TaxID=3109348 RepID=UPI003008B9C3